MTPVRRAIVGGPGTGKTEKLIAEAGGGVFLAATRHSAEAVRTRLPDIPDCEIRTFYSFAQRPYAADRFLVDDWHAMTSDTEPIIRRYAERARSLVVASELDPKITDAGIDYATKNFRLSRAIVLAANAFGAQTEFHGDNPSEELIYAVSAQDDNEENAYVSGEVESLIRYGTAPNRIGILTRLKRRLDSIANVLRAAGIPANAPPASNESLFFSLVELAGLYERQRIEKDFWGADEMIAAARSVVLRGLGCGEARLEAFLAVPASIETIRHFVSMYADVDAEEVRLLQENSESDLLQKLDAVRLIPNSSDGVRLMTIHAARSLEFDTVFVVDVEEGILPLEGNSGEESIFRLALTRAKTRAFLTASRDRPPSRLLKRLPSRTIERIRL